ncbi:DUF3375 domain-containing protein [Herbiconiux sp. A18JL235]|uniref:DUF3375 domain-containing protein n=1 Tax=Herbiconiux sp. A18JL235 TaxID=3152363 RepID=A0AB39BCQ5_9MICO
MSSTRAEAAYQRSAAAFKNPTLDLLHGRFAPFVVAVLSIVFTADRPAVAVADAHAEVTEAVDELRAAGYGDDDRRIPSGTAREICRSWVRMGWLVPQIEDDVEVYRLSAHAVGALEIAGRAGVGRARVSRSRVRTLLEAVDRLARDSEADPERRIALLTAERDALEAEIAALRAGLSSDDAATHADAGAGMASGADSADASAAGSLSGADPASRTAADGSATSPAPLALDDEQLLEEAENVLHLARELPADFARVAESIKAMQRDVVSELRRDVRPTGEILREYLQRGQHVMRSTPEGRAFDGALRLIGDPDRIDQLSAQLHDLLAQPFTRLLTPEQRDELDAIARRVELGVQEVLTAQRRASHVITAQVRTHDPIRDRQVDDLLRGVMAGLHDWMRASSGATRVEPVHGFPVADLGHLRRSLSELHPPRVPEPLSASDDADVEFVDADTRAWGGPHYAELERYVSTLGPSFDLAQAFESGSDDTRRPVDLVGLLEIAHRGGMAEGDDVSIVEAIRPDGTTRRFAFGAVTAHATRRSDTHDADTPDARTQDAHD